MPLTSWAAGQRVTASLLTNMLPLFAYKTADESITSTTTLQDDNELSVAVEASAIYTVDAFLMWSGNETGDIKFGHTFPAGTMHWGMVGPDDTDAGFSTAGTRGNGEWFARQNQSSPTGTIQFAASTAILVGHMSGLLFTGSAGTFTTQWAQNFSNGTATTVKAGSWLRLDRVG
jgi:hypothetical protein